MKEHIYIVKTSRIIKQSFFIWLFVAVQITANIITIPALIRMNQIYGILFINVILGSLTIPGIRLFFNYYKTSADKKFLVTYNSLLLVDEKNGTSIGLKTAEIEKIVLVQSPVNSKYPWFNHGYFALTDAAKNTIVVNSYIMDISELWLDSLARKVSSKKLIREERYFPIIR